MRRPRIFLVGLALLCWVGCRGPGSDPEKTVKAYYYAQEDADVDAIMSMLTPESVQKAGGEAKVRKAFEDVGKGIQDTSIKKMNVARFGEDEAQVQVSFSYVWRPRGQMPEEHPDEYEALYLKRRDGKWYIDLPGTRRVGAY